MWSFKNSQTYFWNNYKIIKNLGKMTVWHIKDYVIHWCSFLLNLCRKEFPSSNVAARAFGDWTPSKEQWCTPLVEVNQAIHAWSCYTKSLLGFLSVLYSWLRNETIYLIGQLHLAYHRPDAYCLSSSCGGCLW